MSNAGDPLGVDIFATNGFPLRMRLSYGQENIQAASLRRLSCDEGVLASIGDDPDYGYNLASHLNEEFNPGGMAAIGARVSAELLKDSRIQTMQTSVTLSASGLQISCNGTTAAGPFSFVANVGDAGVTLAQE